MNKRVHEIAKERGLQSKEVLDRLRAAGIDVKAASSTVDEATATRVLGNVGGANGGNGGSAPAARPRPASSAPQQARPTAPPGDAGAGAAAPAPAAPAPAPAPRSATPRRPIASPDDAPGTTAGPGTASGRPPVRTAGLRRVRIDGGGGRDSGRSGARRTAPTNAEPPRSGLPMPDPRALQAPVDPRRGSPDPRRGTAPAADPRRGGPAGDPRRPQTSEPRRDQVADPRRGAGDTGTASGPATPGSADAPRQGGASADRRPPAPTDSRQPAPGDARRQTADSRRAPTQEPRRSGAGSDSRRSGAAAPQDSRRAMPDPRSISVTPTADPRRGAAPLPDPRRVNRPSDPNRKQAAPAAEAPAETPPAEQKPQNGDPKQRPTRDSLQGERAPGNAGGGRRRVVIDSQAARRGPGGGPAPATQPPRRQRRGRRRRGVYDEEAESRPRTTSTEPDAIRIRSGSTVKDVAEYLNVAVPEVMKKLMALGELKTLTQTLSDESIEILATELGKEIEIVHSAEERADEPVYEDADADLVERAPVVTIMGHVDHGKTSLLDAIRETEVAAGEAGGITQHIGAYQVHHGEDIITFLDTPGHEAFTAMRARGAKVTDIAVIVVAADDGVKPQTQEAVDHAKEAGVPMLVAVNKVDKEGAQPDRVRAEMSQLGLQPVEWGGDTEFVNVSAKTKEGLEDLLETITVMSEVEELRANPNTEASGTVIESKLDPGRGPVVTLLVMRGTLHVGDALVAGANWGRVRAMNDFLGKRIAEVHPGEPVEILGFDGVPEAGEHFRVVEHERRARSLANERATRLKAESLARRAGKRISLEDVFASGTKELGLVLKADVAGSLEAIEDEIAKLPQDEVSVTTIRRAVGAVTESDVMLAAASDAVILAFNVRPVGDARAVAEREGVEIRHYAVIYRAIEELRDAMQGMLAPEEVEETLGTVEVRQIFRASRVGTIAGCYITDGRVTRGSKVRLVRDGTVVYTGEIQSLRRFNEDVREVAAGYECGIVLRDYADVKEGDVMEAYATRQVERELV